MPVGATADRERAFFCHSFNIRLAHHGSPFFILPSIIRLLPSYDASFSTLVLDLELRRRSARRHLVLARANSSYSLNQQRRRPVYHWSPAPVVIARRVGGCRWRAGGSCHRRPRTAAWRSPRLGRKSSSGSKICGIARYSALSRHLSRKREVITAPRILRVNRHIRRRSRFQSFLRRTAGGSPRVRGMNWLCDVYGGRE